MLAYKYVSYRSPTWGQQIARFIANSPLQDHTGAAFTVQYLSDFNCDVVILTAQPLHIQPKCVLFFLREMFTSYFMLLQILK
jgi:hypothetical protein